jgi:hypothetical protein
MTVAPTLETPTLALPAGIEASSEGSGFVLRWDGGELSLPSEIKASELQTLLSYCYDAGFADASNPRLFVP